MIDFKISPRGSGKTREIQKMYLDKPGTIVVTNQGMVYEYKFAGIKAEYSQISHNFIENICYFNRGSIVNNRLYIDEAFNDIENGSLTLNMIICLDSNNIDVILRGTPKVITPEIEKIFEYCKRKYPEYII